MKKFLVLVSIGVFMLGLSAISLAQVVQETHKAKVTTVKTAENLKAEQAKEAQDLKAKQDKEAFDLKAKQEKEAKALKDKPETLKAKYAKEAKELKAKQDKEAKDLKAKQDKEAKDLKAKEWQKRGAEVGQRVCKSSCALITIYTEFFTDPFFQSREELISSISFPGRFWSKQNL